MTQSKKSLPRRDFLKAAGIAGGAAGVAAAALTTTSAKAATPQAGKGSGYRETEHIRKYYESARY
ncbi:MAG: twin-arginine translocation signal domain-containing protein [Rhodospirillales bacterium]|nr:twin-arginine translocation signal domain-containing protein [Rhodospirillales bacterium]